MSTFSENDLNTNVSENAFGTNPSSERGRLIERYLAESDVSIDKHVRRRQLELARTLRGRIKIYLDTNYWVNLRQAGAGIGSPEIVELLALLRELVGSGRAICPLSANIFIELMNQTDPASRSATAAIMDMLSLGVVLIEPHMRMATEVSYLFHEKGGQDQLHPLDDLVWCRSAFILGFVHPSVDLGSERVLLAMQKGVFDELWNTSFIALVDQLGDAVPPAGPEFAAIAEQLNAGNTAHAHEIKSVQQAYRAEAFGIADLFGDTIAQTFQAMAIRAGVLNAGADGAMQPQTLAMAKRLIGAALDKDKARDILRSLHIQASLYAAIRWDQKRKLNGHDIHDIAHASAGLAYCDYLFTEKPLADLITQKRLQLDQRYGRSICGSIAQALAAARQLASSR